MNIVILDLCGGTGSWSKPYKDNGYDVRVITLPEYDVRTYEPPENVYGILAAPPCDQFSFAKTTGKPRDLKDAWSIVRGCLDIIAKCNKINGPYAKTTTLKFWCLENPNGLLKRFLGNLILNLILTTLETIIKRKRICGVTLIIQLKNRLNVPMLSLIE